MEGTKMPVGNVGNVILPQPKFGTTIGGLYWGPMSVTIPTTLSTVPVGMNSLGYIAEAGIDESEDRPSTKIYAWGGDEVAEAQDNFSLSITFTLFEYLNTEVQKATYGANNVTVTAATPTTGTRMSVLQTSDVFDNYRWCWDALAPGGKRVQKWFYSGSVKNRDTLTVNNKTVLASRLTVSMLPIAGVYSKKLTDDGVIAP